MGYRFGKTFYLHRTIAFYYNLTVIQPCLTFLNQKGNFFIEKYFIVLESIKRKGIAMSINEITARYEYEKNPQLKERFGSFEKYFEYQQLQLKRESAWTYGKTLSESIKEGVKDWVTGKAVAKTNAQKRYELAMYNASLAKKAHDNAMQALTTKLETFGNDSSKYTDELKAYNTTYTSQFDADIEVECARDAFNSANSAYGKISWMGQTT